MRLSTGAWLAVALAALFGVQFALHPFLAYPTAAFGLWLLRRQVGAFARILVILVAAGSGLRSQHAIADYLNRREQVRTEMGAVARCAGQGRVIASPVLRDGRFVLIVDSSTVECDRAIPGLHRIRIVGAPDGLARGDIVSFIAQLGPIAPLRQLELSNPIPRLASLGVVASGGALQVERVTSGSGIRHAVDRARSWVRRRILLTYVPRAQALGRALVLGENDLDPDEQVAFQRSGLSHLLAVSGTHLVFAVVSVVSMLRALMLRLAVARRIDVACSVAPLGAALSLLYADFAGGSGSAWRAAWMLSALYAATMFGRKLSGMRALALSLVVGVLDDLLVGYDISFLLSALATAGLVVIGPTLKQPVCQIDWRPLRWLAEALATTVSAMLPCVPLLLLLSPDITLAGMFANVIAGPLGEVAALPLCLLHAVMAPLPWAERGFALAGSGALIAVGGIAKASAAVSWARIRLPPPTLEQFAVLCLSVVAFATQLPAPNSQALDNSRYRRRTKGLFIGATLGCLAILEIFARYAGAPKGRLRVTAIDVGQGDSILVDLPDGRAMLIDGGGSITGGPDPGARVILPLLRARRRSRLDIAVLTHPHPDHFGGLLTVLREVPVGEFWEAGDGDEPRAGELAQLREYLMQRGTRIRRLPELCSTFAPAANQPIQVLGPCPDANRSHNTNDQSLVLRLSWGQRSVLLPGDAESVSEAELAARYGTTMHADLLKLGHHGSRSSTSQVWLDAVQPSVAVVSVGLRNRFGHPHPLTLARMKSAGIPLYRTDELGSVEWSSDGNRIAMRSATAGLTSIR